MKKLIAFLILLSIKSFATSKDLYIELGQEYTLRENVSKVWVENSKIISIVSQNSGITIKTNSLGRSQLRLNNEARTVNVVPIGSLKTYQDWERLSRKFIQLKVDYCEEVVCLKGKVYTIKEFEKLINLIKENNSVIYFAFEIRTQSIFEIQKFIEKYQREKGLTPLKVTFSQPWRLQYANKDSANDYKTELLKIGVLAVESKQKIEIADNVKVSIQVTEVKKEFGRSLGIKYPGSYSAQIIDQENFKQIPFDLSLNANENEGNVKVLASPNLICRSGKEAEFFAGGEFPIRVLNYKVNDIVWKKYGIGLKIKPQIDSVGQMSLQIESEISSLDQSTQIDGVPGLHTHKVSSYFDLIQSRTIALSGLIKNEQGESSEGLPFLRKIPILGRLFSSHDFRESKTELIIFVTPELMKQESHEN
jgi:pilus assembly protein CpaC